MPYGTTVRRGTTTGSPSPVAPPPLGHGRTEEDDMTERDRITSARATLAEDVTGPETLVHIGEITGGPLVSREDLDHVYLRVAYEGREVTMFVHPTTPERDRVVLEAASNEPASYGHAIRLFDEVCRRVGGTVETVTRHGPDVDFTETVRDVEIDPDVVAGLTDTTRARLAVAGMMELDHRAGDLHDERDPERIERLVDALSDLASAIRRDAAPSGPTP